MSDRDRLLLPPTVQGLDGKKYRNELRLDPKIMLMAEKAYLAMVARARKEGKEYRFFPRNSDIIEPDWWNNYLGFMGEVSLQALMGWYWDPIIDQPDPGYDFKEPLRFKGRTLFWKIDSKTFSPSQYRDKTVLLRWDGDLLKLPDLMIYIWCEFNAALDIAAPIGWMYSSEIHPENEQRAPWGKDLELGRDRLHKIEELSTATWVPKAA